jgi:hypothetical protein
MTCYSYQIGSCTFVLTAWLKNQQTIHITNKTHLITNDAGHAIHCSALIPDIYNRSLHSCVEVVPMKQTALPFVYRPSISNCVRV